MKNKRWVDVTGEFTPRLSRIIDDEYRVFLDLGSEDAMFSCNMDGIAFYDKSRTDYRVVREAGGNRFRIERLVKQPEFKWTVESVAAVDWSQKSDIETLEASEEHYDEQIAVGNYGGFHGLTCPACQKWNRDKITCGARPNSGCPLRPYCCGGLWQKLDGTKENAVAVRNYIHKKLEELRKPTFKLGDRVKVAGYSDWGVFRIVIVCEKGHFGIFNPNWDGGHGCSSPPELVVYGCAVPGYDDSHWWVPSDDLTHEKVGK